MSDKCRSVAQDVIQFNSAISALVHFWHTGTDKEFAKTLVGLIDGAGDWRPYTSKTSEAIKEGLRDLIAGNMPPVEGIGPWKSFRLMILDASLDAIEQACRPNAEGHNKEV